MVRECRASGNSCIVHIYANDSALCGMLCDDLLVDLVHHGLEGCRRIAKTEEHDCGFEEAIACLERGLMFVPLFYAHIVVSPSYIQFGEYGCSPKVGKEVRDEGKGVWVADCVLVERPVILYWS